MIHADSVQPADDIPPEPPEPPVPLTAKVPVPAFPTDALPPPVASCRQPAHLPVRSINMAKPLAALPAR